MKRIRSQHSSNCGNPNHSSHGWGALMWKWLNFGRKQKKWRHSFSRDEVLMRRPPERSRRRALRAARTCQVPLQGWWRALVPAVAAEAEPEQDGHQHQNQDPEEPSHGWVSHGPRCEDVHASGCTHTHAARHWLSLTVRWLQQSSWMGPNGPVGPVRAAGTRSQRSQNHRGEQLFQQEPADLSQPQLWKSGG